MRSAAAIDQAADTFGEEPVAPLSNRLRVDLEPLCCCLDRPTPFDDASDHACSARRGQHRVRVLASSVSHEPSRVGCVLWKTHSLTRRAHLTEDPDLHHPAKDNVPGHHTYR